MHALPLLAAFVDPYEIFYRQAVMPPRTAARFGDEPNPEARLFRRRRPAARWRGPSARRSELTPRKSPRPGIGTRQSARQHSILWA